MVRVSYLYLGNLYILFKFEVVWITSAKMTESVIFPYMRMFVFRSLFTKFSLLTSAEKMRYAETIVLLSQIAIVRDIAMA